MNTQITLLSDDALDAVSGGMINIIGSASGGVSVMGGGVSFAPAAMTVQENVPALKMPMILANVRDGDGRIFTRSRSRVRARLPSSNPARAYFINSVSFGVIASAQI